MHWVKFMDGAIAWQLRIEGGLRVQAGKLESASKRLDTRCVPSLKPHPALALVAEQRQLYSCFSLCL